MNYFKHVFLICIFCVNVPLIAQNSPTLESLLTRLNENHMGSVSDVFTVEEQVILKNHFNKNVSTDMDNSRLILNRRISSTQNVTPVTAVDINPLDLSSIEELLPSTVPDFEGAGFVRVNPIDGAVVIDNNNRVWIRGISSGTYTDQGLINGLPSGQSVTGAELTSNGDLYVISTNGLNSSTLSLVIQGTWSATPIGDNNLIVPIALGRDGADNLYTFDIDDDNFYSLSNTTGVATLIGNIGFNANFGQGLTFDSFNDMLLMTAFNNSLFDSELREVNINTGLSTSLGTIVPGTLFQFGWGSMYDRDVLGIEDENLLKFSFSPNPASDILNINSSLPIDSIEIYSIHGQLVMAKTIGTTSSEIYVSSLSTGNYILKVISNTETQTYKFLKK